MKKIKLPKRLAVSSKKDGPVLWGFPEYMINVVFSRDELYATKESCELVAELHPRLTRLCQNPQEDAVLYLTNDQHSGLLKYAVPVTHNTLLPEFQVLVAQCRLALHAAETVEESEAKAAEMAESAKAASTPAGDTSN